MVVFLKSWQTVKVLLQGAQTRVDAQTLFVTVSHGYCPGEGSFADGQASQLLC